MASPHVPKSQEIHKSTFSWKTLRIFALNSYYIFLENKIKIVVIECFSISIFIFTESDLASDTLDKSNYFISYLFNFVAVVYVTFSMVGPSEVDLCHNSLYVVSLFEVC